MLDLLKNFEEQSIHDEIVSESGDEDDPSGFAQRFSGIDIGTWFFFSFFGGNHAHPCVHRFYICWWYLV